MNLGAELLAEIVAMPITERQVLARLLLAESGAEIVRRGKPDAIVCRPVSEAVSELAAELRRLKEARA